jgi:uncharacterized membrane protein YfcA
MAFTAIPVGFFAGLLGIGGGLITVPVLYYIFGNFGLDNSFIMHLAVGTSFSIIIPTSIASTLTHMKYKAVNLDIVKSYGVFVALGVLIGTIFASNLKTAQLILFFSIVTLILSFNFLISKEKKEVKPREINLFAKIILGSSAGFFSAPMGIGGGVMNTPIIRMFGHPINVATGTSAAIGFLIAVVGTIATLIGCPNILIIGVFITPPPIPIGAEKKPADEPRIILANKLISLGFTSFFSLEIKKLKERIRVTIEKKSIN